MVAAVCLIGAADAAELRKSRLRLYEALARRRGGGSDVIVRRKQGEPTEVEVLL